MFYCYPIDEIIKRVKICLGVVLQKDSFLLKNDVHERSVAHKLAEYLQEQFPDWDVDCEYNKKGPETKELDGIKSCSEQRKTDRVFPDIIIHERGNITNNLLVIEIKVKGIDPCDIAKLKKFTSSHGKFKYKLGLFIKFNSINEPSRRWFRNSEEKDENELIRISDSSR